jgi:hypothetical protein
MTTLTSTSRVRYAPAACQEDKATLRSDLSACQATDGWGGRASALPLPLPQPDVPKAVNRGGAGGWPPASSIVCQARLSNSR